MSLQAQKVEQMRHDPVCLVATTLKMLKHSPTIHNEHCPVDAATSLHTHIHISRVAQGSRSICRWGYVGIIDAECRSDSCRASVHCTVLCISHERHAAPRCSSPWGNLQQRVMSDLVWDTAVHMCCALLLGSLAGK